MTNSSPWENRWPIEIDGLPNLKMGGFSMAMLNKQRAFIMALQWVWQCTYHGDFQRCLSEGGIEAAMRFLSSNSIKYTNPKWGIQWDVYLATIILELECLGFAWKMMSINLINGWIYDLWNMLWETVVCTPNSTGFLRVFHIVRDGS